MIPTRCQCRFIPDHVAKSGPLNRCHLDIRGKILSAAGVAVLNDLCAFLTSFLSLSSPLPAANCTCMPSLPLLRLHGFACLSPCFLLQNFFIFFSPSFLLRTTVFHSKVSIQSLNSLHRPESGLPLSAVCGWAWSMRSALKEVSSASGSSRGDRWPGSESVGGRCGV